MNHSKNNRLFQVYSSATPKGYKLRSLATPSPHHATPDGINLRSKSPPTNANYVRTVKTSESKQKQPKARNFTMDDDVILKKIMLTEKDLSEYWGINQATLRKWRSCGGGPIYLKIGGRVLYPRRAVQEYEQTRTFFNSFTRMDKNKGGNDEK